MRIQEYKYTIILKSYTDYI